MGGRDRRRPQTRFREALALWEGPALAKDFTFQEPFAEPWRSAASRGETSPPGRRGYLTPEVRLTLGENVAICVVGELRRALAEAPHREQLWARLMIGADPDRVEARKCADCLPRPRSAAKGGPGRRARTGPAGPRDADPATAIGRCWRPEPSRSLNRLLLTCRCHQGVTRWRPRALPAAAAVGAVGIVVIGLVVLLGPASRRSAAPSIRVPTPACRASAEYQPFGRAYAQGAEALGAASWDRLGDVHT